MKIVLVVVLIGLIMTVIGLFCLRKRGREQGMLPRKQILEKIRFCPLCEEVLVRGQTVRSRILINTNGDKLMEIEGCVHCLLESEEEGSRRRDRVCPVCKKELFFHDVVICRVFDRCNQSQKTRVHVLGCSRCRFSGVRKS